MSYPARGFNSVGKQEGYFDNLVMYCGMAYGKGGNAETLRSVGAANSPGFEALGLRANKKKERLVIFVFRL